MPRWTLEARRIRRIRFFRRNDKLELERMDMDAPNILVTVEDITGHGYDKLIMSNHHLAVQSPQGQPQPSGELTRNKDGQGPGKL